jgi:serine protease Do
MTTTKKMFHAAVLCSAVLLGFAAPATAQFRADTPPRANSQFLYAFRDATAEATKSTVRVLCNGKEAALGTIVSDDGYILTKYSELSGKITCKMKDGKDLDAKIVGVEEKLDLAMLKVDAKDLTPVKFVESKAAPVGNWVASAGTSEDPVAVGVMSVATRSLSAREVAFESRPANRGYLGIQMDEANGHVIIKDVSGKTPAEKAGLKKGDVLLAVNGHEVHNPDDMQEVMGKTRAGDEVTIKVKRTEKDGDKEMELKVTLAPFPSDGRSDLQNKMGSDLSNRRGGFPTFFQHDTVIKPKDCGGPIVDLDGKVLGINIARAGRVESYSIPSETITPILADLKSGKLAPKVDFEKRINQLRDALKKAEEVSTEAEKKLTEAKEALKKQEAEKAEAEKKLKEAKEALEKAVKEAKEKK